MLDLDIIRNQPDLVRQSISKRGGNTDLVDGILELDKQWRIIVGQAEALRQQRNTLTQTKESAEQNAALLKEIKEKLKVVEEEERSIAARRLEAWSLVPQIVADDVPVGAGESANTSIKTVGMIRHKQGEAHEELMTRLDWLDTETAAYASGARFRYLKGPAALAHMKLMHRALEFAIERGFQPVVPPVMAREEIFTHSGYFPFGREDTFAVEDRFLVGTSEPMLLALGHNRTFSESDLPLRLVGFSSCFRREAGSYGKDTRGMFRQHQFDKVEVVSITTPERSEEEHQFLLSLQEEFTAQFDVPYQVVLIGSGDLGAPARKKYDIEAWYPSQEKYRETHSTSNCGDFQARGFNIKYRGSNGQEQYAHSLNGTVATERLLLAIIENNQKPDGSIELPSQLR